MAKASELRGHGYTKQNIHDILNRRYSTQCRPPPQFHEATITVDDSACGEKKPYLVLRRTTIFSRCFYALWSTETLVTYMQASPE